MSKSKFQKVADIQTSTIEKLKEYRDSQGLYDFKFSRVDFTVKRAQLKFFSLTKQKYLGHSATISANISKKDDENLYIYVTIEKTHYWVGSEEISENHLAKIISLLCSYWIDYKEFKKINRVIFGWGDYRKSFTESLFPTAMELIDYQKVNYNQTLLSRGWGGSERDKTFRHTNDDELALYEYIESEIHKTQLKYPSFVIEKSNDGMIRTSTNLYFYENELFKIELSDNKQHLILNREGRPNVTLELKENVVFDFLKIIREEMKLMNLIKPSIKQLKEVLYDKLEIRFVTDDFLEEKIRDLDEKIGIGETENEFFFINQLLSNQQIQYDKNHHVVQDKKDYFKLKSNMIEFFTDNYGKEFSFYSFQTNQYYWFIMISKNENNLWIYPISDNVIPEEAISDAKEVFQGRRDRIAMTQMNNTLIGIEGMIKNKALKVKRSALEMEYKDLIRLSEEEFGKKWRSECGFI